MNIKRYPDLIDAMTKLQKRGFTRTFTLQGNKLHCLQTKKYYKSNEITIVEHHRFEADKFDLNRAIIFAVACADGEKGYATSFKEVKIMMNLLKFMDKVKVQNHNHITDTNKK